VVHWRDFEGRKSVAEAIVPASATRSTAIPAERTGSLSGQLALFVAVGLAVLGLALRLYDIDHEPLWLDEGYTLLFSRLPLDRLFVVGGAHEHPPLYYFIVHLILSVRDSYLVPRLIAAVASSLSIVAIYALGVRLYGQVAGLVAALLLFVAPFHVWYARDGRAYELAGLLVLLSYLCLFSAIQRPCRRLWIAYAAVTALCLYTEYTTAFVLLPQWLLFLRARREGVGRSLLWSWAGVALAFAPWLGVLLANVRDIASDYWIPLPTRDTATTTVLEMLGIRTPCPNWPCTGPEAALPVLSGHDALIAGVAGVAVVVLLLYALLRRNLTLIVLLLWLCLPFVLVLLLTARRSLYLDRVFLDATFPLYLILGAGAGGLLRRVSLPILAPAPTGRGDTRLQTTLIPGVIAALITLALLAASIANLKPIYADVNNPDWRSAARDLASAYSPGQTVIFNPGVLRPLMSAYFPPGWHAGRERPLWFHTYLDVPGWEGRFSSLVNADLSDKRYTLHVRYVRLDADLRDIYLSEATRGQRQIWLVMPDYAGISDTRRGFVLHGFTLLLSQEYFGDTRIELWDRRPPQDFGPAALRDNGFVAGWSRSGVTHLHEGIATQNGKAELTRSFPITAGRAYTVNVEWRSIPPANPTASVQTLDRFGRPLGGYVDRFGRLLDSFPHTEWYDLPASGVWLSQPFGFVAPPGSVRAVIRLDNGWGQTSWRHISVYKERNRP
jgi:4-amino-4-deoxy-L-arabinose transferase-like glycosyltransferase